MSNEVFETILKKIKQEHLKIEAFALHLNGEPLTDQKIFDRIERIKNEWGGYLFALPAIFALQMKP